MTIATDSADSVLVEHPRGWDVRFIRTFMLVFSLLSLVFDYLTFIVPPYVTPEQFRTEWFLESVLSSSLIVLVIHSRRSFFKSQPGQYLLLATLLSAGVTLVSPFSPYTEALLHNALARMSDLFAVPCIIE